MHELVPGLLSHLTAPTTPGRDRDDRGDVPGWVMVTLMTAIVIAALTPFVSEELLGMLRRAFSMVSG